MKPTPFVKGRRKNFFLTKKNFFLPRPTPPLHTFFFFFCSLPPKIPFFEKFKKIPPKKTAPGVLGKGISPFFGGKKGGI
ncbi:hypothetical protein, partial [Escherichia coli]|uniref:hypothetical protein n=1 Tax=Escherichia coli TaxID=562 RepID=UPI001BC91C20